MELFSATLHALAREHFLACAMPEETPTCAYDGCCCRHFTGVLLLHLPTHFCVERLWMTLRAQKNLGTLFGSGVTCLRLSRFSNQANAVPGSLTCKGAGLSADAHTYNALLYAHAEGGDLEGVAALYLGMRERAAQDPEQPWRRPNLDTFTNLFLARPDLFGAYFC